MFQRDHWRLSMLARESVLNVASWRSKLSILVVISVLIGALVPMLMARDAANLRQQVQSLRTEGRGVLIYISLDANKSTAISWVSCERLIDVPGVERAGLVVYPTEQAALTPTFTSLELGKQVSAVYTSHTLIPQLRDYDVAVGQYVSNHSGPTMIEINGHRVSAAPLLMQPAGIELNSVLVLRYRRR